MKPDNPVFSKSILNNLFDANKLVEKASYYQKHTVNDDDEKYWKATCTVQLNGTDISGRIFGEGSAMTKKGAQTRAADAVVAQMKLRPAALQDRVVCAILKIPFNPPANAAAPGGTGENAGGTNNP